PLIVALGGSRVAMGFRPDLLTACQPTNGQAPVVFNFGLCQFGPVGELLCLRRLLAEGIRPDAVLVQVWPPFLPHPPQQADDFPVQRLDHTDLRLVRRFATQPAAVNRAWWLGRLAPWFSQRLLLMNLWLPSWLDPARRVDIQWAEMDRWGWLRMPLFATV